MSLEENNGNEMNKNPNNLKIGYRLNHLDSSLVDINWCGSAGNDNTVLVLTEKGSVYRSEDKGMTWTKKTEVF